MKTAVTAPSCLPSRSRSARRRSNVERKRLWCAGIVLPCLGRHMCAN